MFSHCSSLTTAPELPATTLTYGCYQNMFYNCVSLEVAPELPADTLDNVCYARMFSGCSSLNYIKCLATDISADECTTSWLDGVAASGTFIKDANMNSWTIGETYDINEDEYVVSGIPSGWTIQNATE